MRLALAHGSMPACGRWPQDLDIRWGVHKPSSWPTTPVRPQQHLSCSMLVSPAHVTSLFRCVNQSQHVPRYAALLACIQQMDMDELVMAIRRRSQGFTRGTSSYRGVTQHKSGGEAGTLLSLNPSPCCVLVKSCRMAF